MSLLDLLNQQQQPQPQKGGFDPRWGTALMGIGSGLTALSQGQPVNMAPYAQMAQQQQKKNPLEELLSDPMRKKALQSMPPQMAERILMQTMFGMDMPQADPMDALRREKMQLEIEQMRNPAPDAGTSDMQEYRQAVEQGYQGSFMDYQLLMKQAGRSSTTVNNNMGDGSIPGLSKLGEGYTYLYNPDGTLKFDDQGRPMSAPVPGGPAAIDAEQTRRADEVRTNAADVQANAVTLAAQRAREAAGKLNFGQTGTSLVGNLPWTDSAEVMRQTQALKDMASASFLNNMRQQSKTGGALGNVTERELDLLSRQAGALDPNSPNFLRDLDEYEKALLDVINGRPSGGTSQTVTLPEVPDFGGMTDAELEDWIRKNGG